MSLSVSWFNMINLNAVVIGPFGFQRARALPATKYAMTPRVELPPISVTTTSIATICSRLQGYRKKTY